MMGFKFHVWEMTNLEDAPRTPGKIGWTLQETFVACFREYAEARTFIDRCAADGRKMRVIDFNTPPRRKRIGDVSW